MGTVKEPIKVLYDGPSPLTPEMDAKIEEAIEYTQSNIKTPIVFRPGQKEAIKLAVAAILSPDFRNIVIDAPTGTGKSIISMMIGVILRRMGLSGYIITPEIFLQQQYEADIAKYGFDIPSVYGRDNFTCKENGYKIPFGKCNLEFLHKESLKCYKTCDYYQRRDAAFEGRLSVLNNAFWIGNVSGRIFSSSTSSTSSTSPSNTSTDISTGTTNSFSGELKRLDDSNIGFGTRQFTIFDECHRIDDLLRQYYSPVLDKKLEKMFKELNVHFSVTLDVKIPSLDFNELFRGVKYGTPDMIIDNLKVLNSNILEYRREIQKHEQFISVSKKAGDDVTEYAKYNRYLDELHSLSININRYIQVVSTDYSSIVRYAEDDKVTLSTIKNIELMENVFDQLYTKGVFLTATTGNPSSFIKYMGIENKNLMWIKFESDFNWDESKIYLVENGVKLSKDSLATNLPKAIKMAESICKKYEGKRGLIHTGNFAIAKALVEADQSGRMVTYSNTASKSILIKSLKHSEDVIVVGPSVLEGIDLPDDMCRFQIFFKIPYLNLGDEYVKRMSEIHDDWYTWKTSINLLQGSGRAIRHKDDYADTWIIDASAPWFIQKSLKNIPTWWSKRIEMKKFKG